MKEYIFWLQVTMDDIIPMQILHSETNLLDHLPCLLLAKPPISFPRGAEEIAIEAGLKKQVYTLPINEGMVELDHIGMRKEALDLDLPHQLGKIDRRQRAPLDDLDGV